MSAPLDMVVRGGTVAGVDACFRGDVGIAGGKVAALGVGLEADEIVDAEGCFVVPGAIDVHTHFESLLGGAATADDYESGSRAAAFGGITSFVNYAFQEPGETLHETLERERRKAEVASTSASTRSSPTAGRTSSRSSPRCPRAASRASSSSPPCRASSSRTATCSRCWRAPPPPA